MALSNLASAGPALNRVLDHRHLEVSSNLPDSMTPWAFLGVSSAVHSHDDFYPRVFVSLSELTQGSQNSQKECTFPCPSKKSP